MNRRKNSKPQTRPIARGLGLPEDAAWAIERRVLDDFKREAQQLAGDRRWRALLTAELVTGKRQKAERVLPPLNYRVRQASTQFGQELNRLLGAMIVRLSGEFAQAIAFRQGTQRPTHWRMIVDEATAFALVQIDWERSSFWLARMLQNGGYKKREIHPTIRVAFLTAVGGIFIERGIVEARKEIHHWATVLDTRARRARGASSGVPLTREEIEKRASLSVLEASEALCIKSRMLRKYFQDLRLDRTKAARVVVNTKFWKEYDRKHGTQSFDKLSALSARVN